MKKILIICENYTSIDTTLYLATSNINHSSVTIVIPGNHDLLKFFQVINERVWHNAVKLIYFEHYVTDRDRIKGTKRVFQALPFIINERRHLKEVFNKYFAELEGYEVFFYSLGFSGVRFYLLKKLSRRNSPVYISYDSPDVTPIRKQTPKNIIDLAWLIILKLIYGHDIAMGELPALKRLVYFPDKFMDKYVDRIIDWEEKNEMLKDFDLSRFKIFDVGDYDVIYFGHAMNPAWVPPDTLARELPAIFNTLIKYFPEDKIACKYHPGHREDRAVAGVGIALEAFIPAEFLYSDKVKIYLSFWSTSIANIDRGIAVSLIDLISYKSSEIREKHRELLMQMSRSKILFPKSLDEFEKILADVKQQAK